MSVPKPQRDLLVVQRDVLGEERDEIDIRVDELTDVKTDAALLSPEDVVQHLVGAEDAPLAVDQGDPRLDHLQDRVLLLDQPLLLSQRLGEVQLPLDCLHGGHNQAKGMLMGVMGRAREGEAADDLPSMVDGHGIARPAMVAHHPMLGGLDLNGLVDHQ
jgi:hypothetical protein